MSRDPFIEIANPIIERIRRIREQARRLLSRDGGPAPPKAPPLGESPWRANRLDALASTFRLEPLALDIMAVLLAAEVDPLLRLLLRSVQREVGRPWLEVGTVAELLDLRLEELPGLLDQLAWDGPLSRNGLVLLDQSLEAPLVSTRVRLSPRLTRHLLGDDRLPPWMTFVDGRNALSETLVPPPIRAAVAARVAAAVADGEPLLVELTGPPGAGRRHLATGLAWHLGRRLLVCDLSGVSARDLARCLSDARREQRLSGALLCLACVDPHLPVTQTHGSGEDDGRPSQGSRQRSLPDALSELLASFEGVLFITAEC